MVNDVTLRVSDQRKVLLEIPRRVKCAGAAAGELHLPLTGFP